MQVTSWTASAAPVFLPYLSPGEQGALRDPQLHGTVIGLHLGHGRRHLARGLLNGIVLESRRCLSVLAGAGDFGTGLAAGGGGSVDPGFRADLADATRRRVHTPPGGGTNLSARGAAKVAALGIDGQQVPGGGEPALTADPDPGRADVWDQLWARHEEARRISTGHYHDGPPTR